MTGKALLLVCLALVANAAVHKLKLNNLPGKSLQALKEGKLDEYKQHHKRAVDLRLNNYLHRSKSRASRLAQTLYDYGDSFYLVNATFGTPPQPFQLLVNTYDYNTWIPDVGCTYDTCSCKDNKIGYCREPNTFDRRKSATFATDFRTYFDNHTWSLGVFSTDTLSLGSGFLLKEANFGLMDWPAPFITSHPFDGYLSMSFTPINGTKSILEQAFDQDLIDAPLFTLFLISNGLTSKNQPGGQLTLGGLDVENCSPNVAWIPVYDQEDWAFDVFGTEISQKSKSGKWRGVADPTFRGVLLPQKSFDDIVSVTGATFSYKYGMYTVDCNVKFEWTVTLADNNKFTVTEKNSLFHYDNLCIFMFEPRMDDLDLNFILGSPFVSTYCQVFEYGGRIGFSEVLNK